MTDNTKKFFGDIVAVLNKAKVEGAVEMIAPLVHDYKMSLYQKLRGHIESSERWEMGYSNKSGGYNDGTLIVAFYFPTAKTQTYSLTFSSVLRGDYCINGKKGVNPEWWNPVVSISVSRTVGSATWCGNKMELEKYTDELDKELNGASEIIRLKREIAEKQRELALLTA